MINGRVLLIQAEFFPCEKIPLDEISQDILQRVMDGVRPKTVIRFFDRGGRLSEFVHACEVLKVQIAQKCDAIDSAVGLNRWLLSHQIASLVRKRTRLEIKRIPLALDGLRQEIRNGSPIGFEPYAGAAFRLLERNELHETVERITLSSHAWIWVFEAGPILADAPGKALYASL
jgi:hypothetical protein